MDLPNSAFSYPVIHTITDEGDGEEATVDYRDAAPKREKVYREAPHREKTIEIPPTEKRLLKCHQIKYY